VASVRDGDGGRLTRETLPPERDGGDREVGHGEKRRLRKKRSYVGRLMGGWKDFEAVSNDIGVELALQEGD